MIFRWRKAPATDQPAGSRREKEAFAVSALRRRSRDPRFDPDEQSTRLHGFVSLPNWMIWNVHSNALRRTIHGVMGGHVILDCDLLCVI